MEFQKDFKKQIREFIREWDAKHTVDYLWRQHYNIPFGSKEHFETSFIDQLIWHEEKAMVEAIIKGEELGNEQFVDTEGRVIEVVKGVEVVKMSDYDIEKEFNQL